MSNVQLKSSLVRFYSFLFESFPFWYVDLDFNLIFYFFIKSISILFTWKMVVVVVVVLVVYLKCWTIQKSFGLEREKNWWVKIEMYGVCWKFTNKYRVILKLLLDFLATKNLSKYPFVIVCVCCNFVPHFLFFGRDTYDFCMCTFAVYTAIYFVRYELFVYDVVI